MTHIKTSLDRGDYNHKVERQYVNPSSSEALLLIGGSVLASAILTSIICIGILASATHGFGPVPAGDFYPIIFSIIGSIGGGTASLGLVMLAIGYCKKQNVLAEEAPFTKIN